MNKTVRVQSKKDSKTGFVIKDIPGRNTIYYNVLWEDGTTTKEALTDIKEI